MSHAAAVETDDLVKEYASVRALDGVSVRVDPGETFGLLGPNGAGKTTFIELLVGLADPTDGEARVFGHDVVDDYRLVHDRVGLAPQEFNVDRFFPIRDVLRHKAGYHGLGRRAAYERADEALARVGLSEKADQPFSALSGGMKRRVMLARALVTDPDLLILDEPTAGVDVKLRHDVWALVEELTAEGVTVLLTTHYLEEAERLCDRVCILDGGRVVETDTPDGLKRRRADVVRVTLDRAPGDDAAAALLASVRDADAVATAELTGDVLTIEAGDPATAIAPAVGSVTDAGRRVTDLDVERTSLEDVFVDLTRLDE